MNKILDFLKNPASTDRENESGEMQKRKQMWIDKIVNKSYA